MGVVRERRRWRRYVRVAGRARSCPVNVYDRIIGRGDGSLRIGDACRRDCERNGWCFCGKLERGKAAPTATTVREFLFEIVGDLFRGPR